VRERVRQLSAKSANSLCSQRLLELIHDGVQFAGSAFGLTTFLKCLCLAAGTAVLGQRQK